MDLTWDPHTHDLSSSSSSPSSFAFVNTFMASLPASASVDASGSVDRLDLAQPALGSYCMPTPDSECWPSSEVWESELHSELSANATSTLPFEVGFAASNVMRNAQMASYPAIVVNAMNAADVQACLRFANRHGIRTTIRTTGHDYDGRSNGDGRCV